MPDTPLHSNARGVEAMNAEILKVVQAMNEARPVVPLYFEVTPDEPAGSPSSDVELEAGG